MQLSAAPALFLAVRFVGGPSPPNPQHGLGYPESLYPCTPSCLPYPHSRAQDLAVLTRALSPGVSKGCLESP